MNLQKLMNEVFDLDQSTLQTVYNLIGKTLDGQKQASVVKTSKPRFSSPCRGPAYGRIMNLLRRELTWTTADYASFKKGLPENVPVMKASLPDIIKAMMKAGL